MTRWHPDVYTGSAAHHARGRVPYPPAIATALRDALGLDGTGRLLDVGCGPGSLTLLLAPLFAAATGVDADPGMIEAARAADPSLDWRVLRAEDLPAGLGAFRVVSFAQCSRSRPPRRTCSATAPPPSRRTCGALLRSVSADGLFSERMRGITLSLWRP